jgi:transcriptional regulator with XRE-family HTH domain
VSKEHPATSDDACHRAQQGGEYVFRLDIAKVLEVAAVHGDNTRADIFRRTGITESSVYRILNGETQPDLNSAMRLAEAYDIDLRTVIKRVSIEAAA